MECFLIPRDLHFQEKIKYKKFKSFFMRNECSDIKFYFLRTFFMMTLQKIIFIHSFHLMSFSPLSTIKSHYFSLSYSSPLARWHDGCYKCCKHKKVLNGRRMNEKENLLENAVHLRERKL